MSTMTTEAYCKDNILNLPIYKLNSGEKKIVGLPGIQMSKRYMVPLRGTQNLELLKIWFFHVLGKPSFSKLYQKFIVRLSL